MKKITNEMILDAEKVLSSKDTSKETSALAHFICEVGENDPATFADTVNKSALSGAIASIYPVGGKIDWNRMIDGIEYPVIIIPDDPDGLPTAKMRVVRSADVFCVKPNAKSTRRAIPGDLFAMISTFGGNISKEFTSDREGVATLRTFCKYTSVPNCFFDDDKTGRKADSIGSLESQFQAILDTMTGAGTIKAKKCYVRHLSDTFNKTIKTGYRNGNEVSLLQVILDHAKDAKTGKTYAVKSSLTVHKDPEKSKGKK